MVLTAAEKSARYRAKDVEAYRARKRILTKQPKHREKRTEYMRLYRERNRQKFNEMCARSHKRKPRSKRQKRNDHLKCAYGITIEQYDEMLIKQLGLCLICGADNPRVVGKSWHVDHCHETGKIRGLLCNSCNPHLGWYEKFKLKIESYLNGQKICS